MGRIIRKWEQTTTEHFNEYGKSAGKTVVTTETEKEELFTDDDFLMDDELEGEGCLCDQCEEDETGCPEDCLCDQCDHDEECDDRCFGTIEPCEEVLVPTGFEKGDCTKCDANEICAESTVKAQQEEMAQRAQRAQRMQGHPTKPAGSDMPKPIMVAISGTDLGQLDTVLKALGVNKIK